jgi:hypothetical protein
MTAFRKSRKWINATKYNHNHNLLKETEMRIEDKRAERLRVLTNEIVNQQPDQSNYGLYVSIGGNLPSAGGGFLWYKNKPDFLELTRHLAYFQMVGQNSETNNNIWDSINPIVDQLQSGIISMEKARTELNSEFEQILVEIFWW